VSLLVHAPQSWTILLVAVSLLGYTHYVLGAYYQHCAWAKRTNYRAFSLWFIVLTLVSIGVITAAIWSQTVWLVALLTIPYFVWHGYENEQSLFTRTTGQSLSPMLIGGISIVAVGATVDAFRHASAYFTHTLSYQSSVLLPGTARISEMFGSYIYVMGIGCLIFGSILLLYEVYLRPTLANVWWCIAALLTIVWFWFANPLPYVWLFVLLLGYHFLTWGIHYGVVFWSRGSAFWSYLYSHGIVVLGVIGISFIITESTTLFPLGLLNTELFLAATLVHISTSFLNDEWLQIRLGLKI
jgi:hypothetical protein